MNSSQIPDFVFRNEVKRSLDLEASSDSSGEESDEEPGFDFRDVEKISSHLGVASYRYGEESLESGCITLLNI